MPVRYQSRYQPRRVNKYAQRSSPNVVGRGGAQSPLPKTVVIYGSSTALGTGSTGSNSWALLFKSGLQSIDAAWTITNKSVSGRTTADLITNFDADVTPVRPTHVILCSSFTNDSHNRTTYYNNTVTLIAKCLAIGAIPVIAGAYPYNSMSAGNYSDALALNLDLDALGYPRIDHMSTMDDGSGHYIASPTVTADGQHPNDTGHAAFYAAIDFGIFTSGSAASAAARTTGAYLVSSSGSGDCVRVNPVAAIKSWTLRFRENGVIGGVTSRAWCGAYVNTAAAPMARIRNSAPNLQLVDSGGSVRVNAAAVTPSAEAVARDIVITFNRLTGIAKLYIDGSLIGSGSPVSPGDIAAFTFGGRLSEAGTTNSAQNYPLADFELWQVPIDATAVAGLSSNRRPASKIFQGDMSAAPAAALPNLVPNGLASTVNGTWASTTAF